MTTLSPADVQRLARLSKLTVTDEEAERLAATLQEIAREFAALADHAARLAPPAPPEAGALRDDEVRPADDDTIGRILAAAPRVDATSRAIRVDRP